jgi:type I restriction enzyme, S subunit
MKTNSLRIEDVCDFIGGSQPPKSDFIYEPREGYIRLIQTRDYKTDAFITYIPTNSTQKFCDNKDIMIGRYGPPIFQICRGLSGAYNVALLKAKPKNNIDREYLFYFLKQDDVFKYVDKLSARTGGQTGVDLVSLNKYPIRLPESIDEQKNLVAVLCAIDKKIELNKRINAELEAIAKTLYDYWFVQFDFPDTNGKPYKTSGGKMVYNPILKREIPDGWSAVSLFDAMDVQYGFPFDTSKFIDNPSGYAVARIRDVLENTISCYTTEEVDRKFLLKPNDLLVAMDGNFHVNFWSKSGVYLNQRTVRIREKTNSLISVFQSYFELSPYIKAREKNVSRTTVGHLSDKD